MIANDGKLRTYCAVLSSAMVVGRAIFGSDAWYQRCFGLRLDASGCRMDASEGWKARRFERYGGVNGAVCVGRAERLGRRHYGGNGRMVKCDEWAVCGGVCGGVWSAWTSGRIGVVGACLIIVRRLTGRGTADCISQAIGYVSLWLGSDRALDVSHTFGLQRCASVNVGVFSASGCTVLYSA